MEHRLVALRAADVVGCSRFKGQDEVGTLVHLEGLKAAVLDSLIAQHSDRVIELMGDRANIAARLGR